MGCKFVRDVERFNKWGVKVNYRVMKYGRKVDCLRLLDKVRKEARTKCSTWSVRSLEMGSRPITW